MTVSSQFIRADRDAKVRRNGARGNISAPSLAVATMSTTYDVSENDTSTSEAAWPEQVANPRRTKI